MWNLSATGFWHVNHAVSQFWITMRNAVLYDRGCYVLCSLSQGSWCLLSPYITDSRTWWFEGQLWDPPLHPSCQQSGLHVTWRKTSDSLAISLLQPSPPSCEGTETTEQNNSDWAKQVDGNFWVRNLSLMCCVGFINLASCSIFLWTVNCSTACVPVYV